MRKKLVIAAGLVLALVALALPAFAAGAETLHFSFRGLFAEAYFLSSDPSGCVITEAFVTADDGRVTTGPGQPAARSVAFAFISEFDICTSTRLLTANGFATLAADEFQIDKKLNSATLNMTIEVFDDVSGSSFLVDVSVSWTGIGDTLRQMDHFHFMRPGFKVNAKFDDAFRNAEASGTVSEAATNFSPEPAVSADMGSVKQGSVSIVH